MAKKHEPYRWCLLWQSDKKTEEEVLKDGLEFFIKKYSERPDYIGLWKDGKLKSYEGIPTVIDKQLFYIGLVSMPIPYGIKVETE